MSENIHPRTLIRHALVRSLQEDSNVSAFFASRIYPNRAEHWLQHELPSCGVYMLEEEIIENDISPKPDERRITLIVEVLSHLKETIDDVLDKYCMAIESALLLDTIGKNMGSLVDELLQEQGHAPLAYIKKQGVLRHPADTLLLLTHNTTEIGIAVDANREIGVASLSFTLEYSMNFSLEYALGDTSSSSNITSLPQLLQCISGWDVEKADGIIEMQSRVDFSRFLQSHHQRILAEIQPSVVEILHQLASTDNNPPIKE